MASPRVATTAWRKPVAVAAGALMAAAVVAAVPPNGQVFYPKCPLHALTGLWCPGCGSTPALHDLVTGHIGRALHDNVLLVGALPLVVYLWLAWLTESTGRPRALPKPRWLQLTGGTTTVLIVVAAVFGAARNLPWSPFTALAPVRG